jgi:hypothetical protein
MHKYTANKNDRKYIIYANLFELSMKKKIINIFLKHTEYARFVNYSKNFNLNMYNEAKESELFIKNTPENFEVLVEKSPESVQPYIQFDILRIYHTNTYLGHNPVKNENFKIVSIRWNIDTENNKTLDMLYETVSKETNDNIEKYISINSINFNPIVKEHIKKWSKDRNLVLMSKDMEYLTEKFPEKFLSEENSNQLKILKKMISQMKKTNIETLLKEPITRCIFIGKCEQVLDHLVDINKKIGPYGITPLMFANSFGNEKIINLLLSYGADDTIKDINGLTPLDYKTYSNELFEK